jgi:hypothetical protein
MAPVRVIPLPVKSKSAVEERPAIHPVKELVYESNRPIRSFRDNALELSGAANVNKLGV